MGTVRLAAAAVVLAGCTFVDEALDGWVAKEIGPAGGTLELGRASVDVPAGALTGTVRITLSVGAQDPGSELAGAPVDLGPPGLLFAKPAVLTLRFEPRALPDPSRPELAALALLTDGRWSPLDGSEVTAGPAVRAGVAAAARFGVLQTCGRGRPCPAGQACERRRCAPVELCANGVDDDRDGLVDCKDPDCAQDPACLPACCGRCISDEMCGPEKVCNARALCLPWCSCPSCDVCAGFCVPAPAEKCDNGIDDDRDGLVDCQDPDCSRHPACCGPCVSDADCAQGEVCNAAEECRPSCGCPMCAVCAGHCVPAKETQCKDGIDNDHDGAVDCQDPDCHGSPDCACMEGGLCCYPRCGGGEVLVCLGANPCGYPCRCEAAR